MPLPLDWILCVCCCYSPKLLEPVTFCFLNSNVFPVERKSRREQMTRLFVLASFLFHVSSINAEFRVRLDVPTGRSGQHAVGSQVAVMCGVTGLNIDVRPGMMWMKERGNIASTGSVVVSKLDNLHLSMIITNGTIEDSGVYTCRASYAHETKHESLDLHFFEELKFANELQPIDAKANANVNISCLVMRTKSMMPKVMWQKGFAAITADSPRSYKFHENGQVLQIPKFDPAKDNGKYSCKVVDTRTGAVLKREVQIGGPPQGNREELCSTFCSSMCGSSFEVPKQQN